MPVSQGLHPDHPLLPDQKTVVFSPSYLVLIWKGSGILFEVPEALVTFSWWHQNVQGSFSLVSPVCSTYYCLYGVMESTSWLTGRLRLCTTTRLRSELRSGAFPVTAIDFAGIWVHDSLRVSNVFSLLSHYCTLISSQFIGQKGPIPLVTFGLGC